MSEARAAGEQLVVAVDCNGADLGPAEVAAGAVLAAERGVRSILFGPAQEIGPVPAGIEVVDAPISVAKAGDPAAAVRSTPQASINQATRAIAQGRAQALVCAGATGAAVASGTFTIKRAHGVYRPALALPIPVPANPVTLLDVGANADARREHLVQFAYMGAAFASTILGVSRPRVGLLSNGEEAARGGALVKEVNAELASRMENASELQFVGNVEGGDLVSGAADVIVTDGLTGNISLKLLEGVSQMMLAAVRDAAMSSARGKLGGALLRPSLRAFRDEIDPEGAGGAYLLGLRRLAVVPHGRFTRAGFAQAIVRAEQGARQGIVELTHAELERAGALRSAPMSATAASVPGRS